MSAATHYAFDNALRNIYVGYRLFTRINIAIEVPRR